MSTAVPGDAARVRAAAGALAVRASSLRDCGDAVERAGRRSWQGTASDGFRTHIRDLAGRADEAASTFDRGARILDGYATTLEHCASQASAARSRWANARDLMIASPLNLTARIACLEAVGDHQHAVATAHRAAREAASALSHTLGSDGWGQHWWDPFGWADDEAGDPDRQVGADLLDRASWEPEDVQQGSIGDCYLLAGLMGLLNSDDGDSWVRKNIQWDERRGGYRVTLYPGGNAREYFVDAVYGDGAQEEDWRLLFMSGNRPGLAALYEAAVAQEVGYRDLSNGGTPEEALELITGEPATVFERTSDGYTPVIDELRSAAASGAPIVASTDTYSTLLEGGSHHVRAERPAPGGGTEAFDVKIATSHAYMVDRVDPDGGVWIRNPWGPGNAYDGGTEFKVSAGDFADVFYRVTTTEAS